MDGKPRIEGAASFLRSRGVELQRGDPGDAPGAETLWGLGNLKNEYYHRLLDDEGVQPFPDAVELLRAARESGRRCAMVSSSRNAEAVVKAAGLDDLFDTCVDGRELADPELRGKPEPDLFLEAARRLGVRPDRAAVLEDARSGVQAGRRGGFRRVIGVARDGSHQELVEAGADVVVSTLDAVELSRDLGRDDG